MKIVNIDSKEYTLKYTFEAAECKQLVQKMFDVLSGAYIYRNGQNNEQVVAAVIDGTGEMVADIPYICRIAFYAGLLEENKVDEDEAKRLMKLYMTENKLSFKNLYESLKECMEDDGFFELSGLTEMIQQMNQAMEDAGTEKKKKSPQDHKQKSTSTK